MTNFVKAMQTENNFKLTEKGALSLKSTTNDIVDLFGIIGALRPRNEAEIERVFAKAFAQDELLATKMSFYARNVRGGLGERRTARVIWRYLATVHPKALSNNVQFIPHFGRWDDLYSLEGTRLEKEMWSVIKDQWIEDVKVLNAGEGEMSLMAKWIKSTAGRPSEKQRLGKLTAKALGLKDAEYRKTLSAMRRYLKVVEIYITEGNYDAINYEAVTSLAMKRYHRLFANKDEVGFTAFKEALVTGEAKVNASTLFPYDIMESYGMTTPGGWGRSGNFLKMNASFNEVLEAQWKALINYIEGDNNVLVMADTSASMNGRPLYTSIGLAMYFAERNKGVFKDVFMTFSETPKFVTLKGTTLYDRIKSVEAIVENTNIEKAFAMILDTAISNNLAAEDMPKALVIISDMEFDAQVDNNRGHNVYYERFEQMYAQAGYVVPSIVFWNVESRQDTFHAVSDKKGVQMASGQSAATFKSILNNMGKTPYEAVVQTLGSEEYSMITVQ